MLPKIVAKINFSNYIWLDNYWPGWMATETRGSDRNVFFHTATGNTYMVSVGHLMSLVTIPFFGFCHHSMNFFLKFWWTHVLFVGPLIPLFWTSGDVCPGLQSQGGLTCTLYCLCAIPQIHLWCDTCRPLDSQHGRQATLTHILADVSTSIGGVEVGTAARTYGLGGGSNPRHPVPQHSAL